MKQKSLITLVALTLVALLVTAYSRTPQAEAIQKADGFHLSIPVATVASLTTNDAAAQKIKFPPIKISLYFGRASKNCGGFGICKITFGKLQIAEKGRIVRAELSTAGDGKLQLALLEKAPEEGQTLFVDQDIPLSPDIAKQLGLKSGTIRRGEYAFSENKSLLNARLTR